jgi:hypothetical protein
MTPPADSLRARLRAHASGLHHTTAAVELLIAHHCWLHRNEFLDRFVSTGTDFDTGQVTACIGWPTAVMALDRGQLPCSGSEARILRIAASIGEGVPVDLREVLTELDIANTALVAQAVTRATGH